MQQPAERGPDTDSAPAWRAASHLSLGACLLESSSVCAHWSEVLQPAPGIFDCPPCGPIAPATGPLLQPGRASPGSGPLRPVRAPPAPGSHLAPLGGHLRCSVEPCLYPLCWFLLLYDFWTGLSHLCCTLCGQNPAAGESPPPHLLGPLPRGSSLWGCARSRCRASAGATREEGLGLPLAEWEGSGAGALTPLLPSAGCI